MRRTKCEQSNNVPCVLGNWHKRLLSVSIISTDLILIKWERERMKEPFQIRQNCFLPKLFNSSPSRGLYCSSAWFSPSRGDGCTANLFLNSCYFLILFFIVDVGYRLSDYYFFFNDGFSFSDVLCWSKCLLLFCLVLWLVWLNGRAITSSQGIMTREGVCMLLQ